jgi:hypothetical protein
MQEGWDRRQDCAARTQPARECQCRRGLIDRGFSQSALCHTGGRGRGRRGTGTVVGDGWARVWADSAGGVGAGSTVFG